MRAKASSPLKTPKRALFDLFCAIPIKKFRDKLSLLIGNREAGQRANVYFLLCRSQGYAISEGPLQTGDYIIENGPKSIFGCLCRVQSDADHVASSQCAQSESPSKAFGVIADDFDEAGEPGVDKAKSSRSSLENHPHHQFV